MLVEQHPDGNATHVETIQEVLHVLAHNGVSAICFFVFHHPLSHGGDDFIVTVPDFYYSTCKTK